MKTCEIEFRHFSGALLLTIVAFAGNEVVARDLTVDSIMDRDPVLELSASVTVFSQDLLPLWLEALERPEADLQSQVADMIALARRRGMTDLEEAVEPLLRTLDAPDQHPLVKLAVVRALITLDARQAAPTLIKHAQESLVLAQLIEPALARWGRTEMHTAWLARLPDPEARPQLKLLAIRCLAEVGEQQARLPLQTLAINERTPPPVRLEAARALGRLQPDGLADLARSLASDKAPSQIVQRLVAASLLATHKGTQAESLLAELALDPEPAVAAIALGRLLEIDPRLVVPLAEHALASRDAKVRRLGAEALVKIPTPDGIGKLGPLLDDPHPDVRRYVASSLWDLAADPPLNEPVRQQLTAALASSSWRSLEQGALLAGALDHHPAAARLVELLEFERGEVYESAAWALCQMALPEYIPAMLDKAQRATQDIQKNGIADRHLEGQVSQLFQAFGKVKYAEAEPLLRQYVPKQFGMGVNTRAAAIWALGHLHAGKADPDLVTQFVGRLSDVASSPMEVMEVRAMSAVSLGRMKAGSAEEKLRHYYDFESTHSPVGAACRWAVAEVTGELLPPSGPQPVGFQDWILRPLGMRKE